MVGNLLLQDKRWNLPCLNELFDEGTIKNIKKIFWTNPQLEDSLIWLGNRTGTFSVKSVVCLLHPDPGVLSPWWSFLWSSNLHEMLKLFLWNLASLSLQSSDYPFGCDEIESECHLFWKYQNAKALWFDSPWSLRWDPLHFDDLFQFLDCLRNPYGILPMHDDDKNDFFLFAIITLDQIWKIHNSFVHDNKVFNLEESVQVLNSRFGEFKASFSETPLTKKPPQPCYLLAWSPSSLY